MPASLAVIKKAPTKDEMDFLREVTRPGAKIDVTIPDKIEIKDWRNSTSIICRALRRTELQSQTLMPVLGRLLVVARENQEQFYPDKTFTDFMEAEIFDKFEVGRSTCYDAMGAVRLDLPPSAYEEIPRRSLKLLCNYNVIPKGEENTPKSKALAKKAAEMPDTAFREHLTKLNLIEPGQNIGTVIKIPGTKKAEGMWKGFIESPEIQAYCGTDKPHQILEHMIEECMGEWTAEGAEKLKVAEAEESEGATADATEAE
jgi:hypothetical protein